MSNPAIEVQQYGQSLWLDYIHRAELNSGELQRRIDEEGIRGVTSNPAIFQKAIGESDTYDSAIADVLSLDATEVYEKLAIEDIQHAADLFRPLYDSSHAKDGYVSLEVAPQLAHDTDATIAEAKRLFALVDRPNIMIKIPGTDEGIPAIEEAIFAGINVNVTLLFSVNNYEQVVAAYLKGLERRLEVGEDISRIASVASFFLSRIDVAVDRILSNNVRSARVHQETSRIAANRKMMGQAAIASARLIYKAYQRQFKTSRFTALAEKGAMVQRPLWASTGNKNPAYDDTRYVDNLIGEDTVNTVPPQTLAAFIDHGVADESLSRTSGEFFPPEEVMRKLTELGIDMVQVTNRLQVDGVDAFIESFDTLIDQVNAKITVIKSGVMDRQRLAAGIYADAVTNAIRKIDKDFVNGRLWSKDASLWTTYNPERAAIEKRLGWLDVMETIDIQRLKDLQDSIRGSDIKHIILPGMGGSSIAPEVLYRVFGQQENFPELIVLDSTDPVRIKQVESQVDIEKTLFVVATKSGETVETMSLYRYFWQVTEQNSQQFIAITDPGTPLAQIAEEKQFRDTFLNPPDIGGRYSALSYYGMVAAALIGLDIDRLWSNARHMMEASHENIPGQYHPGISLGVVIGTLALEGRNKITIYATQSMRAYGDWAEQLLAESLGKSSNTVVPVVNESITNPSEYVTDRLFIYIRVDDDLDCEEMDAKVKALREAGHPRLTLRVPDIYAIAGEFFRWEFATAIAGHCMELNPFDEHNVSEAKKAGQEKLNYFKEHGHLQAMTPTISGEVVKLYMDEYTANPLRELCRSHGYAPDSRTEVLAAQMAGTHAGDYFAILVYLTLDDDEKAILAEIQHRLRGTTKRAVTVGYGPRYLHSAGQLHKGGANSGVYFQVTGNVADDIDIPGSEYSFGTAFQAQAAGDLSALQAHKRRVIRIQIDGDVKAGLQKLLDAVKFVEDRRF